MEKSNTNHLGIWLKEIRAPFLVLPVLLTLIGGAAAHHDSFFNPVLFILTVVGVVLAHISVNLFNEYSDWETGIDSRTERTPFSGGSGNLQSGVIEPRHVKSVAWISLIVAFFIGLYLTRASGWPILVLMGIGGLTAITYTDHLTRCMLGELASGITLGSFVVIGSYFVQTSEINSGIIWASIPPGILTSLLLFLNEFPDAEADRSGGRRHLVIVLGKRVSGIIYSVALMSLYLVLLLGVITGELPKTMMVCFLTFPLAVSTSGKVIRHRDTTPQLIPALGMNVIIVLATDFLMTVGYCIG
jgi:1,4-dihydroxy-2-naphthoate octaprenyltransferase